MADSVKIVLSGYYGFDNIGDEAVLYSIITALRKEIQNAELIVLSNNPDKTRALYNVKSVNRWKIKEVAKVIKECDLLISGGGSLLQDVTSSKTIPYYLAIVKIAQFYKKKVVFYSQGIGPVNKGFNRFLIKKVVNRVDGIFVRDSASKTLLETIGVKQPVHVAIDPVLGIRTEEEKQDPDRQKTVGIYIRPWQNEANDNKLTDSLTPILTELLSKGYKLCIIPMHYNEDREIARALCQKVRKAAKENNFEDDRLDKMLEVADRELSIKEVLDLTGQMHFVIGMRLHSLIMAAACHVPMLGLSYDPKVTAFIKEMDGPEYIDTDKVTSKELTEKIRHLEAHLNEQKEQLQKVTEAKKERIYLPVHCIKELLEYPGGKHE